MLQVEAHLSATFVQFPATPPAPEIDHAKTDKASRPDTAGDRASLSPSESYFERALTFAAIGNVTSAINALRQATQLQPDMAPAWRTLVDLLRYEGDTAAAALACKSLRAAQAAGTYSHRAAVPPAPEQIAAAERRWADLLKTVPKQAAPGLLRTQLGGPAPDDVVAMVELAARVTEDRQRDALLRRAVSLAPDYLPARSNFAMVLFNNAEYAEALPHFDFLYQRSPDNFMCRAFLAVCLGKIGEFDRAIELLQECGKAFDAQSAFLLDYAEVLKYAGRREDTITILRIVLEEDPANGTAWFVLADVKTEPFSPADIATMQQQLTDAALSDASRIQIHYALGGAFEQQRNFAESFSHYAEGAARRRKQLKYDDGPLSRMALRGKAFFTPQRFAATAGMGCQDPAPIFILGMPRAGSTLVEQILASHSMVEGTMELPEISNIVRDIGTAANGFRYPECLADYDAIGLAELGQRYIDRTRIYRHTERPFYIDKRPSNWAHIGLIQMILPNAKIIDVRRHPMANCFAVFRQYFGRGAEYSYDLVDAGRYYNIYLQRMAHINHALPGRVHRVLYETLVDDTESEIRRLLAYCGLPFEAACLRFWETRRSIATPSAEQVRQPVFRNSLEQWRNFEPWLDKLKQTLAAPGVPAWNS
jgi:tetratricopeptide (TPR) repeat protein